MLSGVYVEAFVDIRAIQGHHVNRRLAQRPHMDTMPIRPVRSESHLDCPTLRASVLDLNAHEARFLVRDEIKWRVFGGREEDHVPLRHKISKDLGDAEITLVLCVVRSHEANLGMPSDMTFLARPAGFEPAT